ncbi:SDR family NAD(P)-dependent oxidoreductase [Flavihumibacter petaseus]|uniref:Putative oxidoreductase n=1 Tax=Flavihumibacter petaseus NBRC 106054 TaxID=1220578 RepID=A0A0E9MZQ4_9BACT|nr:SDR family NAD(P)-dependent oxidoreductase [Flavihumibacter petaseus]GAO42861.1 putative oxidoreductase [Flavihumibacter petaseus NBRC 106054]
MNNPIILVTGGTGFLGTYIIRELLRKGYTVRAIKRASSKLPAFIDTASWEGVDWHEADLLDVVSLQDAFAGVDAVIHAGAVVSFKPEDRRNMYAVNVTGTANVVNVALQENVRRLVHISSVAALGRTANGEVVNETKSWTENKLNTHYAISKFHGELEAWRGFAEGLEGVVLNPSTVLGYGDWNTSSCAIFRQAYQGMPWYTEGVNGFVGVEDLARATVAMLESQQSMERFVVSAENLPFRTLMTSIGREFGQRPPWRKASPAMGGIAWRLEKLRSLFNGHTPLLSRETARIAQSKTYFDSGKLLTTLPEFRFTPLEKVIRESCSRYLQQLKA